MSESGDASLDPPSPLVGSNALDLRREVNIKLCNSFISQISDGSQLQFVRSDLLGIVMAPEFSACLSNATLNASQEQSSRFFWSLLSRLEMSGHLQDLQTRPCSLRIRCRVLVKWKKEGKHISRI